MSTKLGDVKKKLWQHVSSEALCIIYILAVQNIEHNLLY